jgi:hypothetical protein
MIFFIFDQNREETTNLVNDYRSKITYQVYDVIKVNETERCDSDFSSSEDLSSDESEYSDYSTF